MGNVPAQYQYQGSQTPNPAGYYKAPPRPDYGSGNYTIYNTVNATSYSANIPANPASYSTSQYQGGYAPPQKPYSDLPPPSYEQAAPRGPPRPQTPGQPDPDTFDREEKPRRGHAGDAPASRQGSVVAGDDPARSYNPQSRRQPPYDETTRRSSHR